MIRKKYLPVNEEISTANSECFDESNKKNGHYNSMSYFSKKANKRRDYDNDTVLNNALRTFEITVKELIKKNESEKDRKDLFFCGGFYEN